MAKFDFWIFGYRKLYLDEGEIKKAANVCLSKKLCADFSSGVLCVSERDFKQYKEAFDGIVGYRVSEPLGLYGFLFRHRKAYGFFIAAFIGIAFLILSSLIVWDVRIEGCESGRESEIIEELADCGLFVGNIWGKIDKSAVELKMLSSSENVSWINVNRRGTVAYVSVIDKIVHEDETVQKEYSNIVAERDCIIEEITVIKGYPMVKAGESVKAGDILISGIMPEEVGGGFCAAEGIVIGRYTDSVSVCVPKKFCEKDLKSREIYDTALNFFGFSINIFKNYRNIVGECDIIEDESRWKLFGKTPLPIKTVRRYVLKYEKRDIELSEAEMAKLAAMQLNEDLNEKLDGANLLRLRTNGHFENDSYVMESEYVCSSDIGKTLEFDYSP